MSIATPHFCIEAFVPEKLATLADPQTAIPAIRAMNGPKDSRKITRS
jgi:hypothetical protein